MSTDLGGKRQLIDDMLEAYPAKAKKTVVSIMR